IRNSPGPLTLCRLPARRMTNFCQALATLRESVIRTAMRTRGAPAQGLTSRKSVIPARPAAAAKNKVIGFMVVTPRGGVSLRGRRAEMKTTELSATGRLLGRARHLHVSARDLVSNGPFTFNQ